MFAPSEKYPELFKKKFDAVIRKFKFPESVFAKNTDAWLCSEKRYCYYSEDKDVYYYQKLYFTNGYISFRIPLDIKTILRVDDQGWGNVSKVFMCETNDKVYVNKFVSVFEFDHIKFVFEGKGHHNSGDPYSQKVCYYLFGKIDTAQLVEVVEEFLEGDMWRSKYMITVLRTDLDTKVVENNLKRETIELQFPFES